ncbi:MAG: nitronate monooxygenase [Xanthomonadaceae bacterium]|nr:nitronate monooxygenase [Xanthomonadaceae bacterium]
MPSLRDHRLTRLLGIDHPLLLAPMAGAGDEALAVAIARAGGLGSLPCAMLEADTLRARVARFRTAIDAPLNLNFFCHAEALPDAVREARWRERLAPYYDALGIPRDTRARTARRRPFDAEACTAVEALRPEVVSFHFGLPAPALLARVKACGARVLGCATTVEEARWLAAHGCDAIIAQGWEAGGHRGAFLEAPLAVQPGLFALLPQVVDAVDCPVIAAGGIGDARAIRAAHALGAAGVQLGTAFLLSDEARIRPVHRAALQSPRAGRTAVTNLFSGRPARGIVNRLMEELGPMSDDAPAFPAAGAALAPLRERTEPDGIDDFVNLWAGEAAPLARTGPAGTIARELIEAAFKPS